MPKVIVIIGPTGGIGNVITRVLYARGHSLVLAARTKEKLESLAGEFGDAGRILTVPADISAPSDIQEVLERALAKFGRVDGVINSSGTWEQVSIDTPIEEKIRIAHKHIAQHAFGVQAFSAIFLDYFRAVGSGLIANISSHAGHRSDLPGNLTYAPAKAYAQHLFACLASELKAVGANVRVTDIVPAIVNIPELAHLLTTEEMRRGAVQPEDIAVWFADNLDNPDIESRKDFESTVVL